MALPEGNSQHTPRAPLVGPRRWSATMDFNRCCGLWRGRPCHRRLGHQEEPWNGPQQRDTVPYGWCVPRPVAVLARPHPGVEWLGTAV